MKKITYLLLSIIVIFSAMSLCACGGDDNKDSQNNETTTEEATTEETTTEEDTTEEANGKVTYTVKVVDETGNAIVGAMVQCCKDACVPGVTNDNGVAEFVLAEDAYDVKFISMPEGYTYSTDEEVFNFEDGKTELTITLKAE